MRFMPEIPLIVARDVDPEVARDGQHRHRLGGRVEAGHHRHVAALPARVGLVAEGLDLGGVRDEGTRVRADQEQVERLAGRRRCGDQVLGVDLLDLVEAVVGVDVEAPDPGGGQQDDEGERVEGPPPPAVLALLLLLARGTQLGLQVGPRRGMRPRARREARGMPGSSGVKDQKVPGREVRYPSPVHFELPDELLALRDSVRRLAQDKVKPRARAIDKECVLPDRRLRGVPRRRPAGPVHPGRVRRLGRGHPRPGAGH